jgi:hypothetical protein
MDPATPPPATTPEGLQPAGLEQIMQALHKLTLDTTANAANAATTAKSTEARFEQISKRIDRVSSSQSSHSSTIEGHTSVRPPTGTDGELVNDDGEHRLTGGIVQFNRGGEQSTPVNAEFISDFVNQA